MYIGEDLQNAHIEGYIDGLKEVYRAIVDNEDLPERTNPHYLDGRIDKQNLILSIIENMLVEIDEDLEPRDELLESILMEWRPND